ncbi:MAG TPA: N-acetylglucosamine-6-phosphate deacetylase [Vicinamibacterales bacterium]|nr:N-acetylglucosamine-6-phosphate deacetylase [Vicinamibacterales bacterium]
MIALSGADLVVPDRVVRGGSIVIDKGRIAAIESRAIDASAGLTVVDLSNHTIVPGFVDVHIHGVEGIDVLDGPNAVDEVAKRLPKYGVTAFCPTSVACTPTRLTTLLNSVARALSSPANAAARVLPAHLESNFINPEWNGAQPIHCLRTYKPQGRRPEGDFAGHEILQAIVSNRQSVGIVTLAPEISGGLDLVRDLVMAGHRVSLGHTGATYDEARDAIALGAHHATHLFNRMSSLTSRSPGVVGAVLESDAVCAEIICDGHHVHPSLVAVAIRVKSASRMIAITDATAAAGLPAGSRANLGDQTIIAGEKTAVLEDGTLAGSILTMDAAFRMLVKRIGLSLPDAARMCATTPAAAMKQADIGSLAVGKWADLAVLDHDLRIVGTYVAGEPVKNQTRNL